MDAHTYKFEGGGGAVLGSIQPQPIPQAADGTLPLDAVERAIKPVDPHFARTRLLALENTWHGRVLPMAYLRDARELCDHHGLRLHLDGARLYNAAVALGLPARDIAMHFDSVSVCLSKGLGAPVGSVLAGSREFIDSAKRWRKVCGGGMRQAGILAAGALHALDHHVARLADDHRRAATLARELAALGLPAVAHTNMVFVDTPVERQLTLKAHLRERGIAISTGYLPTIRLVMHLDVDDDGVARTVEAFRAFAAG
jgi:threonine aldolase